MKQKILYILSAVLAALLGTALLILGLVYFYQDEIVVRVKEELAEQIKAEVHVENLSVQLYESFPDIKVRGEQMVVISQQTNTELLRAKKVDFVLDLEAFLKDKLQIKKLRLEQGYLHMTVSEEGVKNFDIFPKREGAKKKAFRIFLANIEFENFGLIYDNGKTGLYCSVRAEDFYASLLSLKKQLSVFADGQLSVFYLDRRSKTLLQDRKLAIDTRVLYNFETKTISVRKGDLRADRSVLSLTGMIGMKDYKIRDLRLVSDHLEVNTIASFLPEKIAKTIRKFRPEGFIKLIAEAQRPDTTYKQPTINAYIETDKSLAVYLEPLDKQVKQLQFKANFSSGEERTAETYHLNVVDLSGKLDGRKLEGDFKMENFKSPFITANLKGKTPAGNLTKLFAPKGQFKASGLLTFDAHFEGTTKQVLPNFSKYNRLALQFDQLTLTIQNYRPTIRLKNGDIHLTKKQIDLGKLQALIGRNRIRLDAEVNNWLALAKASAADPQIKLYFTTPNLYLQDVQNQAKVEKQELAEFESVEFSATAHFDAKSIRKGRFLDQSALNIHQANFLYKSYPLPLTIHSAKLAVKGSDLRVPYFNASILDNRFDLQAYLHNILAPPYQKKQGVEVNATINAPELDVTELIAKPAKPGVDMPQEHKILEDLHFQCKLQVPSGHFTPDSLLSLTRFFLYDTDFKLKGYDPVFHDFAGEVHIVREKINIKNFQAFVGHSDVNVSGKLLNAFNPQKRLLVDVDFQSDLLDFDELILKKSKENKPLEVVKIRLPDLDLTAKVDKVKYKKYTNRNFKADLSITDNELIDITTLETQIAGGRIAMRGILNVADKSEMMYDGVAGLYGINMIKFLEIFENFNQHLLTDENIGGQATAEVTTTLYVDEKLNPDMSRSDVVIDASIKNGKLNNFKPLQVMSLFFENEELEQVHFDEISNILVYRDSTIYIPKMKIATNLGEIYVTGTQNLSGRMNYYVEVPVHLLNIWPVKAIRKIPYFLVVELPRKILGRPPQDEKEKEEFMAFNANVHVTGTPQDWEVAYEGEEKSTHVANEIIEYYRDELKLNIDKLLKPKEEDEEEQEFR